MGTLPFSRGDVRANRDGLMSHAQRARILENIDVLRAQNREHVIEASFVAVSTIGIAVFAEATGITLVACALVCAAALLLFTWLDTARLRRLHADVDQLSVAMREGPLAPTSWLDRAGIKRYGIQIDKQIYRIPRHVFEQIESGQQYRVYYGKHSGDLLSMEEL